MTANTITLSTGHDLDLDAPQRGHVTALGIAWGLAQINRFSGQCLRPYSVAEHSLLVAEIAERELGLDVHGQLLAHLHDAHEFVATDMHTPGKRAIGMPWAAWEVRWEHLVHSCFALHSAARIHRDAVKRADLIALATERRDLLPRTAAPWPALEGIEPVSWVNLNSPERRAMGWEDWRDRWLDHYHALDFARNDAVFGSTDAAAR